MRLLTGCLPFDPARWRTEVLRELREDDPPSPSTKLNTGLRASMTAENRNTHPKQLESLLRGDLDWIVLKALEKDRTRRYGDSV